MQKKLDELSSNEIIDAVAGALGPTNISTSSNAIATVGGDHQLVRVRRQKLLFHIRNYQPANKPIIYSYAYV